MFFGIPINSIDALALTLLTFISYNTLWTIRRKNSDNSLVQDIALFVTALGFILYASIWSGNVLKDQSKSDLDAFKVQTFSALQSQNDCSERFDQAIDEFLDAARIATQKQIEDVLLRMRQERGFESEIQACLRSLGISGDHLAEGVTAVLRFEENQMNVQSFFLGGPRIVANVSHSLGLNLRSTNSIAAKSIHYMIVSYPIWPFLFMFLVMLPFSLSFDFRTLSKKHWGVLTSFVAIVIFDYALNYFDPST